MSKMFHFPKWSLVAGDVKVNLNLTRFEGQYEKAQFWLDGQVMNDMVPYMSHREGNFINQTRAYSASLQGTGQVAAAFGVQGRFLYEGKVMVDELTGSPWARSKARKIVTDRPLIYSNPKAAPRWFNPAKEAQGRKWIKGVKKYAGG